jgi:ribosomal protein L37AE/L43A
MSSMGEASNRDTGTDATVRDCPECGRHDEHLMMDGEWICHSCGHVEFPPGRDPAAPWRESPAAHTVSLAEAERAIRAKAAFTTNPAYQRHLLKFLRLLDWAQS